MSKENAMRFIILKDKDESLKNAFDAIMGKYEGKNLIKDEQDKVLQEEIIPLAKQYGYEFTIEDFAELQADGELSDEELDQITGGRGEFSGPKYSILGAGTIETIYSCDYAPDDQTFKMRYNQLPNNCPDYKYTGICPTTRDCSTCEHLHFRRKTDAPIIFF